MSSQRALAFGPFLIDLEAQVLLRDRQPVPLRPKTWAVLRHLVERPGRLVTKDELLGAVWPDVSVVDALPGISVAELRTALGDDPRDARFIATVHRRGYRFIAAVVPTASAPSAERPAALVGRDDELRLLRGSLERAAVGERQVVFVSGEAGIGKTTLVEAFTAGTPLPDGTALGRGQCLQHHGPSEPFLPVLDALGSLRKGAHGERIIGALRRHAPLWLPWVGALEPGERDAIERDTRGATPARMVRTLAEALEAASADAPLVLVLEDLQWSDPSTVDLLGRMAFGRERAGLLVLGTYRPAELVALRHPLAALRQQLRLQRRLHEITLDFLDEEAVETFLTVRFPGATLPGGLAPWLLQRTEGNPLFMTHVADALEASGIAVHDTGGWTVAAGYEHVGVPDRLQDAIHQQAQALPEAQREALGAASIAGAAFSAAAVAAATATEVVVAEETCEAIARETQFIRRDGEATWPDGTASARYAFVHALYREVLGRAVPPARRARLHLHVAERLETAWGPYRAPEIAGDLALHYERGGDVARAARHHEHAAEQALARQAPREALMHLDAALALRERLTPSPERTQDMVRGLIARGWAVVFAEGDLVPAVATYERARALCATAEETPQVLPVLGGLCIAHRMRGDLARGRAAGEEGLAIAQRLGGFPLLLAAAYIPLASTILFAGDIGTAHAMGETALGLLTGLPEMPAFARALDARVAAVAHLAVTLTLLGRPEEAKQRLDESLALARESGHLVSLLATLTYGALVAGAWRDWPLVHALTAEVRTLADDPGLRLFAALARGFRGHALAAEGRPEAIPELTEAMEELRRMGVEAGRPSHLYMLALAHAATDGVETARRCLAEAVEVAATTGEHMADAELYRLKADLLLPRTDGGRKGEPAAPLPAAAAVAAEEELQTALRIARSQQARWFELRATVSLARLWSRTGRATKARGLLAAALEGYPDDSDLPDLREAYALRAALAQRRARA